jgi:hypothetical protein
MKKQEFQFTTPLFDPSCIGAGIEKGVAAIRVKILLGGCSSSSLPLLVKTQSYLAVLYHPTVWARLCNTLYRVQIYTVPT